MKYITVCGMAALTMVLFLTAGAEAQDAMIKIDAVEIMGEDISSEPLADWEDLGLPDSAEAVLRGFDRRLLWLALRREELGRKDFEELLAFPYDLKVDDKLLRAHFPPKDTIRMLMLLFMMQE